MAAMHGGGAYQHVPLTTYRYIIITAETYMSNTQSLISMWQPEINYKEVRGEGATFYC
jgi:hypothetical protein